MSWTEEHLRDSAAWFNPWPIKYLMPVEKWLPLYWPNEEWEVREFPPSWPMEAPIPPDGVLLPWWKQPKDMWPFTTPFEPKIFGAWPSSQISMPEDLQNNPPFGFIKLKVPGEQVDLPPWQKIAFQNLKIHTRRIDSTSMRMMTMNTSMGTRFYLINKNWDKYSPDIDVPKITGKSFYQFVGEKPKPRVKLKVKALPKPPLQLPPPTLKDKSLNKIDELSSMSSPGMLDR